jgi:transposase
MASAGCQWRMLPKDLPPPSTVQRYFYDWRDRGLMRMRRLRPIDIAGSVVAVARRASF